jgi:poly(hydroxyalkanoate) granule-associated protein
MATTTQDLQKELKKTTDDAVVLARDTVESVQRDLTETAGDVRDAVQKVFLAGLGALVVTEEEGSKLFKKLVKKGEKADLPKTAADRVEAVRTQIGEAAGKATGAVKGRVNGAKTAAERQADETEDRVQDAVKAAMKRLGVPTREEIAELTASVERLSTNIERLKEERAQTATSTEVTMEAVGGGWYEVKIGDVVVEKVQGREDAEATVARVVEQRG